MDSVISQFKTFTQQVEQQLKEDLKGIRSGRANPSLLEGLMIEVYGSKMRLMEVAAITTEPGNALVVVPYDPSASKDIEKGIQNSPLGLSPQPQGGKIIVRIPPMSQEQREKFMKLVSQKAEERRVMIRNERDNARKKIKVMFDAKDITEDQKFRGEKEIDNLTQAANSAIQTHKEHKDKEIMEV